MSPEKVSGGASGSECGGRAGGNHWRSCTICLEEMCQTELKTHHTCEACLLCDGCIEVSVSSYFYPYYHPFYHLSIDYSRPCQSSFYIYYFFSL